MRSNLRGRKPGLRLRAAVPVAAALLLAACAQPDSSLEAIHARGALRMVTVNAPTSYYLGAHGPEGFEYRLASAFARSLGVPLVVKTVASPAAMRSALARGRADIAAAQISPDVAWREIGLTSIPYQSIPQLVVQARGHSRARSLEGLRDARLVLVADSPQQTLLEYLRIQQAPYLNWTPLARDRADPLDVVSNGGADYAIVDASDFAFAQHLYPECVVAFELPNPRQVQWVMPESAVELQQVANRFIESIQGSGELAQIEADARDEQGDFDYVSARQFQADIAARLPALQSMFEEAARATGLDWRLLAAVGYQESRWQGAAASPNGALGIMMLTNDTASTVGVSDRANQRDNILGGARYLAQVMDTIPKRIAEPDRTWLALAAYNVGYGHLEDARVLAQMHGKNPDSWDDVRGQLPLLAEEQWFNRVKRGYARGWEPARFVEQVKQYLAVLEWLDADKLARNRMPPKVPGVIPASDTAGERRFN
jgi:membrane-bound lytic murein transglycosylase F